MQYLLTDHCEAPWKGLGSVVAITDASGNVLSQQRYLPFGQVRTDVGNITQTDFGYTGQRALDNGLMDYHARFYDVYITHFSQPDSIIPDQFNPQALNRYSYAGNNPVRYNDPSGHCFDPLTFIFCAMVVASIVIEAAPAIEEFSAEEGPVVDEAAAAAIEEAQPAIEQAGSEINQGAYRLTSELEKDSPRIIEKINNINSELSKPGLLRYIHPNDILPNGEVMSRAFKDPRMSVFDESLGATPQLVLDIQSADAGVVGQGKVMAIDPEVVIKIPGVNRIVPELGTTGNDLLNAAHTVIDNLGTRSVAQHIRDIAQWR